MMLKTGTRKCSLSYHYTPCLLALTAYLWLLTLLGSATAQEGTQFKCYTNGQASGMLRLDVGENGLSECVTKTECSEAIANPKAGHKTAMYHSGCNGCPKWKFEFECKTCKYELCNNRLANDVMVKNRICFIAQDEETMGAKTAFCADGVDSCFYHQYTGQKDKDRYTAGCGTGWTDCSECNVCDKDACNVPEELKSKAQIPERPTLVLTTAPPPGAPAPATASRAKPAATTGAKPASPVKPKAKNKKKVTGGSGGKTDKGDTAKGGEEREEEAEDEKTDAPIGSHGKGKGKGRGRGKGSVTEAPATDGKKGKDGDEEEDAAADGGKAGGAASSGSTAVAAVHFVVALTAGVAHGLVILA